MEREAVYLVNEKRLLHLRENNLGVGFADYERSTRQLLAEGIIPKERLSGCGPYLLEAGRSRYLSLDFDERVVGLQQVAVSMLEPFPSSGIKRRRRLAPESLPKDDIRFIDSRYNELFRIPNGGTVTVTYPDGAGYTAKCTYLDDYHTQIGGRVHHICEFAERMQRAGAMCWPETFSLRDGAAWTVGGSSLAMQICDDGWEYTLYDKDFSVRGSGVLEGVDLYIEEAREKVLAAAGLDHSLRDEKDLADFRQKADARRYSLEPRPSPLAKLALLSENTAAPKPIQHDDREMR